jgi:hypothetical protein
MRQLTADAWQRRHSLPASRGPRHQGVLVDLGQREAGPDLGQIEHAVQALDHLVDEAALSLTAP